MPTAPFKWRGSAKAKVIAMRLNFVESKQAATSKLR
jgi:hypothetical protein